MSLELSAGITVADGVRLELENGRLEDMRLEKWEVRKMGDDLRESSNLVTVEPRERLLFVSR